MRKINVLVALAVLVLTMTACGGAETPASRTVVPTQAGAQPTKQPLATTPPPTRMPTVAPSPTVPPSPTPAPIGRGRANPAPIGQVITVPGWEVKVLDVKRGDTAWQLIKAANQFNKPAPEGREYVLATVQVKYTGSDTKEQTVSSGDWDLTGSKYIRYSPAFGAEPKRLDAKLFSGGQAEGMVAFLAGKDETNLELIYQPLFSFDPKTMVYFAAEPGAKLTVPADLASLKADDQGKQRTAPVALGQKVIAAGWEVTVLEAKRGDAAWQAIKAANQFNQPPEAGKEYVLALVHLRYVDRAAGDSTAGTSGMFRVTGGKNVVYDAPSVVLPSPELEGYLYAGGETTGWVKGQAEQGETGLMLVFRPLLSLTESGRFFKLEQ